MRRHEHNLTVSSEAWTITFLHYNDVIMGTTASQITSLTTVYSTVYSRRRSKKTSKLRVTGLCEGNSPVNSPHKWPVTRKIFPFDDVIMWIIIELHKNGQVIRLTALDISCNVEDYHRRLQRWPGQSSWQPFRFSVWHTVSWGFLCHYNDIIMGAIASQITSLTIVYWTVYSDADQRKHQSSVPLAFVWGIHRWPVNSPHKWPVTRKCFHLMMSSWKIN